jgi:cytochrome P450
MLTYADVLYMCPQVLLRACIRESIRLLPVVLQLKRVSARAGAVGRYACPKNTAVIVDVAGIYLSCFTGT